MISKVALCRTLVVSSSWAVGMLLVVRPLSADEGMWLFNRLPAELLRDRHGFEVDPAWGANLQRSAVRFSSGGSGAFVSPRGLLLTNHHVVSSILQELSTRERNLLEDGFFARSPEEELPCPGLEVLCLWEIVDVTERVRGAARDDLDAGAAEKARRAERALIEEESRKKTGLFSEVVSLYRGGEYHVYRYRRFDDVRLVMAPEVSAAFLGGDAQNFSFPRFCLDISFLRAYEDGKPARVDHYLRWSRGGVASGDLVFVAGHPGSTQRLNTVDHLRFLRDTLYPSFLERIYRREIALQQFSLNGSEERRLAKQELFSVENGRKAVRGILQGLLDPELIREKERAEAELQARVAENPELGARLDDWRLIADSFRAYEAFETEYRLLERGAAFWSDLFGHARAIVRLVEEKEKPSAERLPEYRDAGLPRVEMRLFAETPIEGDLEVAKLADSLTDLATAFGADHPLVRLVLSGSSPRERARALVRGTRLDSASERRRLVEGGKHLVGESDDAMVSLARSIDPYARDLRRRHDDLVKSVQTNAYAAIFGARYATLGRNVYPDATFTLRLAFGVVKGWREGGREIPPFTTMGGAFDLENEHAGEEQFRLPSSWHAARDTGAAFRLESHLNFVSTADIVGGNSGSPVMNRAGELVGVIFDGNIHSLVWDIAYTEEQARAVAVSAEAILEALRNVYHLNRIADEIAPREREL